MLIFVCLYNTCVKVYKDNVLIVRPKTMSSKHFVKCVSKLSFVIKFNDFVVINSVSVVITEYWNVAHNLSCRF